MEHVSIVLILFMMFGILCFVGGCVSLLAYLIMFLVEVFSKEK